MQKKFVKEKIQYLLTDLKIRPNVTSNSHSLAHQANVLPLNQPNDVHRQTSLFLYESFEFEFKFRFFLANLYTLSDIFKAFSKLLKVIRECLSTMASHDG